MPKAPAGGLTAARYVIPHRAELTEAERRQHIAEWVRITVPKLPHRAAVSERGIVEGRGNEGAILKASRDLGLSKDSVQRAVSAESLPAEAKAVADAAGLGTVDRAKAAKEATDEAKASSASGGKGKAQSPPSGKPAKPQPAAAEIRITHLTALRAGLTAAPPEIRARRGSDKPQRRLTPPPLHPRRKR